MLSYPKESYIAVIPARGGSKRISRKNLALLNSKPLIAYTIQAAISSKKISRVIVSTDNKEIAEAAKTWGAEVPFLRPKQLADSKSPIVETILHVLENIEQEDSITIVLLQPTSPFRNGHHIDESIMLFEKSGADTVTSVNYAKEHPYYAWTLKNNKALTPYFSRKKQMIARQDLPVSLIENGAIYIIKKSVLKNKKIYGKKVMPYIMDQEVSVDIDTPYDLLFAEFILQKKTGQI